MIERLTRTHSCLERLFLIILFMPSFIYYGNFILSLLGLGGYFSYLYGFLAINSSFICFTGLFRKNGAKVLVLLSIALLLILSAFIVHGNGEYIIGNSRISLSSFLVSDLGHFYSLVVPLFVLYLNGVQLECLFLRTVFVSRLIILLQLIIYYLIIRNGEFAAIADDYMSFAYYGLLPIMVLFINKDKSVLNLLLFVVGVFSILIIGCRGALVTMVVFVLIYYFYRISLGKRWTLLLFAIAGILLILFGLKILELLNNQLEEFGFSSRTLAYIVSDNNSFTDSSGRDKILTIAFSNIKLLPDGLWGDRQYSNVYVHNWILEIMLDFGVFLGTLIVLLVCILLIKALKFSFYSQNIISVALFAYSLSMLGVKFLVSSSLLVDSGFILSVLILLYINDTNSRRYVIKP